jgi:crotonobetainyl-CoA:carnitine CoA-transferase CaiB-like acyl-CoA transferase
MPSYAGLSNAMFNGVRIVELAQYVFVPGAGAVLADLGAEVIKIEAVSGDPYRTLRIADGRQTKSANLSMEQNNRGKKSLALDLKRPEGRELLLKLIETTDIFLTSLRPAALERLALGPEELRARNPRLIYVRGNGFGFHGADANRPGYDASAFWARGGFAHILTPPGQPPIRPRPALGDHASAMNIAFGMAAALFNRERTGQGSVVEISLLGSAMWILSADVALSQAVSDSDAARFAKEGRYPLTRPYETSDGRWIQLMFLDPERYWPELCRRVERSELLRDPRFVDGEHRAEYGDALCVELENAFRRKTLAEWRAAFVGWDAPWELIQTIKEVAADPQAAANGYLFKVQVADGTDVTVVAGPVAFNGSAVPAEPRCAPSLGQHSDELLRSIGVSTEYLQECKKKKVIVG